MSSNTTATIELIYDEGCPNVAEARGNLLRALHVAGLEGQWTEWSPQDPESPARVRGFASPTVLVDGRDVAGGQLAESGPCCRLYLGPHGAYRRTPEAALIVSALKKAQIGRTPCVRREAFFVAPGAALALLPKLACPACWPAYAGFLSALGLGFLLSTRYLLMATVGFFAIAVGTLAFSARRRRGYGPFLLGLNASAVVVAGKFYYDSNIAIYLGLALLVGASVWNARRAAQSAPTRCPACSQTAPGSTRKEQLP